MWWRFCSAGRESERAEGPDFSAWHVGVGPALRWGEPRPRHGPKGAKPDRRGKRGQAPFVRSTLRAVPANGACPLSCGPRLSILFTCVPAVFRQRSCGMSDGPKATRAPQSKPLRDNKLLELYPAHSVCRRRKAAHGVCRIHWNSAPYCLAGPNLHCPKMFRRSQSHSCSPRQRASLPGLAPGSRDADADEQPGPRRGRAARGADRLRRIGQGRAELGLLPENHRDALAARERRDAPDPKRQAGGRALDARRGPAGIDRQFAPGAPLGHLGRASPAGGDGR